jgi:hypothetical protein
MTNYLIYRHGSNAANQSMTPTAVVCSVEAKDQTEAVKLAADRVTVYNNQRLEAIPASKCSKEDNRQAFEANLAIEEEDRQWDDIARDVDQSEASEYAVRRYSDGVEVGRMPLTVEQFTRYESMSQQPEGLVKLGQIPRHLYTLHDEYQGLDKSTVIYLE